MMQYGIWIFDEKLGLIGKPDNFPELYLKPEKLWETKETQAGPVWKWPIELAALSWFNLSIADDFNKVFFYAHKFLDGFGTANLEGDFEINIRTVRMQTEILSDYFPGPEEEISVSQATGLS